MEDVISGLSVKTAFVLRALSHLWEVQLLCWKHSVKRPHGGPVKGQRPWGCMERENGPQSGSRLSPAASLPPQRLPSRGRASWTFQPVVSSYNCSPNSFHREQKNQPAEPKWLAESWQMIKSWQIQATKFWVGCYVAIRELTHLRGLPASTLTCHQSFFHTSFFYFY